MSSVKGSPYANCTPPTKRSSDSRARTWTHIQTFSNLNFRGISKYQMLRRFYNCRANQGGAISNSLSKFIIQSATVLSLSAMLMYVLAGVTVAAAGTSGKELYQRDCARCHGDDGKGAAPSMRAVP